MKKCAICGIESVDRGSHIKTLRGNYKNLCIDCISKIYKAKTARIWTIVECPFCKYKHQYEGEPEFYNCPCGAIVEYGPIIEDFEYRVLKEKPPFKILEKSESGRRTSE